MNRILMQRFPYYAQVRLHIENGTTSELFTDPINAASRLNQPQVLAHCDVMPTYSC